MNNINITKNDLKFKKKKRKKKTKNFFLFFCFFLIQKVKSSQVKYPETTYAVT